MFDTWKPNICISNTKNLNRAKAIFKKQTPQLKVFIFFLLGFVKMLKTFSNEQLLFLIDNDMRQWIALKNTFQNEYNQRNCSDVVKNNTLTNNNLDQVTK